VFVYYFYLIINCSSWPNITLKSYVLKTKPSFSRTDMTVQIWFTRICKNAVWMSGQ